MDVLIFRIVTSDVPATGGREHAAVTAGGEEPGGRGRVPHAQGPTGQPHHTAHD